MNTWIQRLAVYVMCMHECSLHGRPQGKANNPVNPGIGNALLDSSSCLIHIWFNQSNTRRRSVWSVSFIISHSSAQTFWCRIFQPHNSSFWYDLYCQIKCVWAVSGTQLGVAENICVLKHQTYVCGSVAWKDDYMGAKLALSMWRRTALWFSNGALSMGQKIQ
jgi:hypothetical protein